MCRFSSVTHATFRGFLLEIAARAVYIERLEFTGGGGMRKIAAITIAIVIFTLAMLSWGALEAEQKPIQLTESELRFIEQHPVIFYAPDISFPPYEFWLDDYIAGIVPDYLEHISGMTGITFKEVYFSRWSEAVEAVKKRRADLIFASEDESRKRGMLFTNTVVDVQNVVIGRLDGPDTIDFNKLGGKRIGIMSDYIEAEILKSRYPDYDYVLFQQVDKAVRALSFGEIDYLVLNVGTASYSIEKQHIINLKVVAQLDIPSAVAFGIREDYAPLQSIINKALDAMPASEKRAIARKWIQLEYIPLWRRPEVLNIALGILVVAIAAWSWIVVLSRAVKSKTNDLLRSQRLLETVIDHIPHYVYVRDIEGRYVMINKRAAEFYGTTRDKVLGRTHTELVPESSAAESQRLRDLDGQVFERNESVELVEQDVRDIGGNRLIFDVYKRPIQLYDDDSVQVLTVSMDVTQRVISKRQYIAKEEELRRIEQNLAELDKKATLGSLVGGITHEINNPIGISVTALSHLKKEFEEFKRLLEDKALTQETLDDFIETADDAIAILGKNIERAVEMISSFKRMSVDQLSGTRVSFDLCETIGHVVHSLAHETRRKQVVVVYECLQALMLDSYPGSYSQVLTNLMMNSLIHGFEGQQRDVGNRIEIQAYLEGDNVVIQYKDNGAGMDAETLERVWQPYFTTKRDRGGSGLGMQIIYNTVVRTLGGKINFSSQPGEGVSCTIEVPRILREK